MADFDYSLWGRIGAYEQHARHNVLETSAAGRAAFMRRFEDQVDPDRLLDPADRASRAKAARAAYMLRLAHRSREARRRKSMRP